MLDVKHFQHQVNNFLLEVLSGESSRSLSRHLGLKRKIERLTDRESGMVVFVLFAVHSFAAIPFFEEVGFERTVQHLSINLCVAISLVADNLEESCASASWSSQNQNHLTRFGDALEVPQDIKFFALLTQSKQATGSFEDIEERDECVRESLSECQLSRLLAAHGADADALP